MTATGDGFALRETAIPKRTKRFWVYDLDRPDRDWDEAHVSEEAGRIAGFKKGDMAEAAERLVEGKGWLPPVLRTVSDAAEPEDESADEPRDDDRARPAPREVRLGALERTRTHPADGGAGEDRRPEPAP